MTKLCISFVEVTGKGDSVIKENPQQAFPVVVVVWISIAVSPVKINNAKNDYSYVKTNQKSGNENSVKLTEPPSGEGNLTSDQRPLSTPEIKASGEGRYFGHGARKCSSPATCVGIFPF